MLDPLSLARLTDPERLAALQRTTLLDSPAEESFDRLTRLAARMLHAPVALLALLDGDRQFLKSCVGIPEPWASTRVLPVSPSFCRHAVDGAAPLVVADAREHPLLDDDPALLDLGFAAYLGMPLTTQEGHVLGTFCVLDRRPRQWTADEVEALRELTAAVMTEIALREDSVERDRIAAELRETVERYHLVMRATNDTIWELDLETGEGTWNDGIQKMFGYPADEVSPAHQWWAERIHPEDRDRIDHGIHAAVQGSATTWTDEYRFRAANGNYVTVLDRAYIARDGEGRALRIVGSMIDITERSRVQREREEMLAGEIAAKHEAERANRAKSDFLAVMSHELRTPLTAIMGYTDLLLEGIPVSLPSQARQQVERIDYAARHLLELIEQVLLYSRVEAAQERLEVQEVDLRRVAQDVAALVEPLASKCGLTFDVQLPDLPVPARTESGKARQILLNFLSNAMKFTSEGRVSLRLEAAGEAAIFRVRDTGMGIAPEHLGRVFEPFWQAQQGNTRQVSGTGLGLAVCQRLAELLGGEVRVESEIGRGTEFTLRLPCLQVRPPG